MISWDLDLLQRINRDWTSPALDYLMPALSAIEAWIPILIVLALIAAIRGGRRAWVMLACVAVAVALTDGVAAKSMKSAVGRVRPRDAMSGVIIRDLAPGKPAITRLFKAPVVSVSKTPEDIGARGKSFPSSHTANMFAAAVAIGMFYRGWGLAVLVLACGVAYSRVYVGAHWPSDIPPSMGLGAAIGWTVTWLISRFSRKRGWLPPGG